MKKLLVLGAGSSVGLGYPVGSQLRKEILQLRSYENQELVANAGLNDSYLNFDDFLNEFKISQIYSVDSFLARRVEFAEAGKRAIATVLISRENEQKLFDESNSDNWQQYFFNSTLETQFEKLDYTNIKVISFNYDRTLEHFLIGAIKASFGVETSEAEMKLKTLEIVHVYGTLGSIYPSEQNYHSYNSEITSSRIDNISNSIKVIPEGRNDDQTLVQARKLLENSEEIIFLGYGFDKENTRDRLNATNLWSKHKRIAATCMGMTAAEAWQASKMIGGQPKSPLSTFLPYGFDLNHNCSERLRELLFFTEYFSSIEQDNSIIWSAPKVGLNAINTDKKNP